MFKSGDILKRIPHSEAPIIAWTKIQVFDDHIVVLSHEPGYGPTGRNDNFNVDTYNEKSSIRSAWALDESYEVSQILKQYNDNEAS
jgi:hypothetical protein